MHFSALSATALLLLSSVTGSIADDWTAGKLRGPVFQYVDNHWVKLERGMIVPDDRPIQTLGDGYVVFTRGEETIDVGPATQIRIIDRGTAAKPATTVNQYFGTVSVEAQVEAVQHFTVQTPYLAAVVKGTKFTVNTTKSGTDVSVQRGHVAVEDHNDQTHVLLSVGQSAGVDIRNDNKGMVVAGDGELPSVVPSSVSLMFPPSPDETVLKTSDIDVDKPVAQQAKSKGNIGDKGRGNSGQLVGGVPSNDTGGGTSINRGNNNSDNSAGGNSGNGNSGNGNSGNGNSGNGNAGNGNSGSGNSGNGNSGNGNGGSGNCNGVGNKNC